VGLATVCQNVAITVNSDNSIDQSSLDLKVFPNPAKDYCTFQLLGDVTSDYDWYLLSGLGQTVLQGQGNIKQQQELTLEQLSPGIYWLNVATEARHATAQIGNQ
jgi:hypothetical protein